MSFKNGHALGRQLGKDFLCVESNKKKMYRVGKERVHSLIRTEWVITRNKYCDPMHLSSNAKKKRRKEGRKKEENRGGSRQVEEESLQLFMTRICEVITFKDICQPHL